MLCGSVCLSHSPLMHHNRAPADVEAQWNDAVDSARQFIADVGADHCIIFFPDHVNGFFYNLMPPFCIGAAGESLGDFGTAPGPIDIPEDLAADCHSYCLAQGIDVAISYNMTIDHGGTQPFELLAGDGGLKALLPIFINCIAPPLPSFARAHVLGRAIGEWAKQRPERIVTVGSGGLSHDPPLPSLKTAVGATAERLRKGGSLSYSDRIARQHRVLSAGKAFGSHRSAVKPLNPDWDRATLRSLVSGKLDFLNDSSTQEITDVAGSGAHELRTWIASLAALDAVGGFDARMTFYEPVEEWITGMGLLIAQPKTPEFAAPPSGADTTGEARRAPAS